MRIIALLSFVAIALVMLLWHQIGIDAIQGEAQETMTEQEIMVPMRDSVRLWTKVWLPAEVEPARQRPVVLSRGYWPRSEAHARRFTAAGYAFVAQAARGETGSEGTLDRFFADGADGYDTLEWIVAQPWSSGQIAMIGPSYWGATQWLAAETRHPNLAAIIPQNIDADLWRCVYRCNGALSLAMTASGRAYTDPAVARRFGWEKLYRHLPLIDLDVAVSGRENGLWRDYVAHAEFDEFWRTISLREKYDRIRIPVYMMSGWYDYYAGAAFNNYRELKAAGNGSDLRVVIGPTDHLNRVVGDRDFGEDAAFDDVTLAIRWLDHVLLGKENGVADEPPIRIFVMGANTWRFADDWPLPGTRFTPFYLRRDDGTGRLTLEASEKEMASTSYLYDPADPVPTLGGNHSFTNRDRPDLIRAGTVDQRPNEDRADVLVFTSPVLEAPLEVTGPVEIVLYAASSAPDTDFTAKLIDVHPDGTAYNLTEGILRARFRTSIYAAPKLLTPGEISEYRFQLHPTSNLFRAGHRIRLHVSSSNFPLWDRNPNTGNPQGMDDKMQPASQTIHHSARYPSRIILPVISGEANGWPRPDLNTP